MEKKASKNVLLAIMGVLILAEIIALVISMFGGDEFLLSLIPIVSLAFVALYGFWFYKKPHGNMLKYAMLLLAFSQILYRIHLLALGCTQEYSAIIGLLCAGVVIYAAGRLNRIEQNKFLLVVVTIVMFICGVLDIVPDIEKHNIITLFTYLYESIVMFTLMIAYFVRYKEHKEAGLADAPKKIEGGK